MAHAWSFFLVNTNQGRLVLAITWTPLTVGVSKPQQSKCLIGHLRGHLDAKFDLSDPTRVELTFFSAVVDGPQTWPLVRASEEEHS